MSKGLIGSVILFIVLVILPLSIYIYKSGFTIPTLDWFRVMTYLIPSSVIFCGHLLLLKIDTIKKDDVSDTMFAIKNKVTNDFNAEVSKSKGLNLDVQNSIKDMDDAKQKMMTDIDVRLKKNNDALIERIDKRMDVIDSNLNNKLDTTIANSRINEIIIKMDENNQNLKTVFDFNDNVIANKLNQLETLWANSMTTIIQTMELSKKAKQELIDELNRLKMKLSKSRGDKYNQTLNKYHILKAKMSEMK